MKEEAELDGCTFHPSVRRGKSLPHASYVYREERHHHLQHYLEGQSFSLESQEDDFAVHY